MIKVVKYTLKCVLCVLSIMLPLVYVPYLTSLFSGLLLYSSSSNIVSSPLYFCFWVGIAGLALFLKAQKLYHLPWKDSIASFLSALSLLVVSDVPGAFSAHLKHYCLFSRRMYFQKWWGGRNVTWRQGCFPSPFPSAVLLAGVLSSATHVASLEILGCISFLCH